MANIQLQIQDIMKKANTINNQLADIKNMILQAREHKLQLGGNIYRISEELHNISYRDMKQQVHHIQILLADKLSKCKEKGVIISKKHV